MGQVGESTVRLVKGINVHVVHDDRVVIAGKTGECERDLQFLIRIPWD